MVHYSYGPEYLWATTKSFWSSTHMGHILSELRVDISMGIVIGLKVGVGFSL